MYKKQIYRPQDSAPPLASLILIRRLFSVSLTHFFLEISDLMRPLKKKQNFIEHFRICRGFDKRKKKLLYDIKVKLYFLDVVIVRCARTHSNVSRGERKYSQELVIVSLWRWRETWDDASFSLAAFELPRLGTSSVFICSRLILDIVLSYMIYLNISL